jgi:site-specific DNA-methyltransferase (adenine-specific)
LGVGGLAEAFRGRPLFEGERGIYVLGDARELLRTPPDASADAVITDPPWGVFKDDPYDDFNAFLDVRDELHRVMRRDSWLVFFFSIPRIFELQPYTERFSFKWLIPYLFFGYGTGSRTALGTEATYGAIMVFAKGNPKVAAQRKDVIVADELPVVKERVREPQFKPTFVVSALLTTFTREGDLVLDPFAGYGSIPLVCELFNRRWLAFEIDPLKFKVAERIIKERRVPNIARLKKELAGAGRQDRGGAELTRWLGEDSTS